ncbi:hypothetical protein ANO11243_022950 [Dothideomycetidae sp. 11243]|nr:hypothetical protein ANO11243_022950 [fungal sp. No.11243]
MLLEARRRHSQRPCGEPCVCQTRIWATALLQKLANGIKAAPAHNADHLAIIGEVHCGWKSTYLLSTVTSSRSRPKPDTSGVKDAKVDMSIMQTLDGKECCRRKEDESDWRPEDDAGVGCNRQEPRSPEGPKPTSLASPKKPSGRIPHQNPRFQRRHPPTSVTTA